jgi:hypothetical protein
MSSRCLDLFRTDDSEHCAHKECKIVDETRFNHFYDSLGNTLWADNKNLRVVR